MDKQFTISKIFDLLKSTPNLTSREIDAKLGISRASAHMQRANVKGSLRWTDYRFCHKKIKGKPRWYIGTKRGEASAC